jgi:hypothetical protein
MHSPTVDLFSMACMLHLLIWISVVNAVMHCLTMGIHSEKCVVGQFHCCANVVEFTYTNLASIAIWYSLLLLGSKPVQHVTVLNIAGNCNTMVSIIILNLMGPLPYIYIYTLHHWRKRCYAAHDCVSSDVILNWHSCNVCSTYACDVDDVMHLVVPSSNILVQTM